MLGPRLVDEMGCAHGQGEKGRSGSLNPPAFSLRHGSLGQRRDLIWCVLPASDCTPGTVSRDAFDKCFEQITRGAAHTAAERDELAVVLSRLYDLFDTDNNGVVDFVELSSALCVLCGGDIHTKAKAWSTLRLVSANHIAPFSRPGTHSVPSTNRIAPLSSTKVHARLFDQSNPSVPL